MNTKPQIPKNVIQCQNIIRTFFDPLFPYEQALQNNDILTIEDLERLAKSFKLNTTVAINFSLLHLIRTGNFKVLTDILSKHPNTINTCITEGSPLNRLLRSNTITPENKLKGCKLFIKYGANTNVVHSFHDMDTFIYDSQVNTPLNIAVKKRSADIVRLLLRNGAVSYPPLDNGYDKAYLQYEKLQYKRERLFLAACFLNSNKTSKIFWLPKDIKCLIYQYLILR